MEYDVYRGFYDVSNVIIVESLLFILPVSGNKNVSGVLPKNTTSKYL